MLSHRVLGWREGGIEGLRTEVRNNMERELGDALRNTTKQRVMEALLANGEFEVPQALVDEESKNAMEMRKAELTQGGARPVEFAIAAEHV